MGMADYKGKKESDAIASTKGVDRFDPGLVAVGGMASSDGVAQLELMNWTGEGGSESSSR